MPVKTNQNNKLKNKIIINYNVKYIRYLFRFSVGKTEELNNGQYVGNAANLLIWCMMVILRCLRGFHFHQMSFLLRY